MAAKTFSWNIDVEGIPYKVVFEKNQITINSGAPLKLKQLKKVGSSMVETSYALPIENQDVVLHIRQSMEPILSVRGKDCTTGEEYVPLKVPGWAWIFVALHLLNFVFLIGGAVGGALQAAVIIFIMAASANPKKSTGTRVLICAGIWLLSTVLQFLLAVLFFAAW